jgi:hypothetical protein
MQDLLSKKEFSNIAGCLAVTRSSPTQTRHTTGEEVQSKEEEDSSTSQEEDDQDTSTIKPKRANIDTIDKLILTTDKEKTAALYKCHNNPMSGHFRSRRTLEKLSRRYTWKGVTKDVQNYCKDCQYCKRSKSAKHKLYRLLQPLQVLTYPWEEVTIDFITELPTSTFTGILYNSILVVVDRLTKISHYILSQSD